MPVNITVRNVDDGVRDELAARAARSGRSLQEYLSRELRRLATTPSAEDAIARARAGELTEIDMAEIVAQIDAARR